MKVHIHPWDFATKQGNLEQRKGKADSFINSKEIFP
jgi:hypothetical protein